MSAPETKPCRACGGSIGFAANGERWIAVEPESLREHVTDADGRIIFDSKLGHKRHTCDAFHATRAAAVRPAGVRAELVAAFDHAGRLERSALDLRARLEQALARLDGGER